MKKIEKIDIKILRHCAAHLLSATLVSLFPRVHLLGGGPFRDGFFYDCIFPESIEGEILSHISESMLGLAKSEQSISHIEMLLPNAISFFKSQKQRVRVTLLEEFAEDFNLMSLLRIGDFMDLTSSKFPEDLLFLNTGLLRHFRLIGTEAYERVIACETYTVTRIKGIIGGDKKDFKLRLKCFSKGKSLYYPELARDLKLFDIKKGPLESFIYKPKGNYFKGVLFNELSQLFLAEFFIPVTSSLLFDMALVKNLKAREWSDIHECLLLTYPILNQTYALMPNRTLQHMDLFKRSSLSAEILPLSYFEYGQSIEKLSPLYPGEQRQGFEFWGDTLSCLCTEAQLKSLIISYLKIIHLLITMHGVECKVRLKTGQLKFLGQRFRNDDCKRILLEALEVSDLNYEEDLLKAPYFALDISYIDALGREWDGAGLTIDNRLPTTFDISYLDEWGARQVPILLRGSVFSSIERFMAMLLEHYAGEVPERYLSKQFESVS